MIKIYCMFKIKDKSIYEKILDYVNRISKYEKIEIIQNVKKIPNEGILLDENGETIDSIDFSKMINESIIYGDITFVVGPPEGFDENEKIKYRRLSLSKMTLQHEIALLVLTEQIYRAISIKRGIPYHK